VSWSRVLGTLRTLRRSPGSIVGMTRPASLLIALWLLVAALGCGGAELGESCDDEGSTDECVDDAVCTNEDQGAACRALCDIKEDCPAGYDCNGVSSTSLKSCQPDDLKK
jgi:hypothetical protein